MYVRTIVNRIKHAAKGEGQITFVTGEEPMTLTWGELHQKARAVAAGLQGRGVSHGDRVALLGPTTAGLVTALQAVWLTGATPVVMPLPMRLASIEEFTIDTKARIAASESVMVLIDSDLAPFVVPEADDPPMYDFAEIDPEVDGSSADQFVEPDYHDDDLFVLQFTSGSTSEPKGVMLPNHVMAANLDAILEAAEVVPEEDVMVSWLPLYHDMGLVGFCILPMSAGIDLVLAAPQDFLAFPGRWMEWISTYGGTATAGPNFSYSLATRALKRSNETLDLSTLRVALNGAEPVDPASVRSFIEAGERHGLRPEAVFPAFGMAEVAIAGCFPKPMTGLQTDIVDAQLLETEHRAVSVGLDDPNAREMVILGRPVPGLEFRITELETGAMLGDREVGELQIKGTSVMTGYYKRPEADTEFFDGEWLRTGDLAYLVDGQMVMCGRIKDMIIVGGRNVYPQDVERSVGEIDGIRAGNVVAFGVRGNNGKERLVVVAETRSPEVDRLSREVGSRSLASVGVPCRDVALVKPGSLPKTSSGKLQRALCREQYLQSELETVA